MKRKDQLTLQRVSSSPLLVMAQLFAQPALLQGLQGTDALRDTMPHDLALLTLPRQIVIVR